MKTLFLDIDGVLHPFGDAPVAFCWAPMLEEMVGSAEVTIVIHSTWRHSRTLEAIREFFPQSLRPRIAACTQGMGRYEGIRDYVEKHAIADYLVLDDIADFFPEDWPNLLLCAGETGISDSRVQEKLRTFLAT